MRALVFSLGYGFMMWACVGAAQAGDIGRAQQMQQDDVAIPDFSALAYESSFGGAATIYEAPALDTEAKNNESVADTPVATPLPAVMPAETVKKSADMPQTLPAAVETQQAVADTTANTGTSSSRAGVATAEPAEILQSQVMETSDAGVDVTSSVRMPSAAASAFRGNAGTQALIQQNQARAQVRQNNWNRWAKSNPVKCVYNCTGTVQTLVNDLKQAANIN